MASAYLAKIKKGSNETLNETNIIQMSYSRRKFNNSEVSDKNIVIDPISGRPILGKNLDKSLNNLSLNDRKNTKFDVGDRVREFLKVKRSNEENSASPSRVEGAASYDQFRLSRNYTAGIPLTVPKQQRTIDVAKRNANASFDTYINSQNNRNLSTDGIEGASPKKFRHLKVLSVFGGNPGRYHGYGKDQPVGGTYLDSTSKLWNEFKANDDGYVAGSRLFAKRDFQAKKKVNCNPDNEIFSYSDISNTLSNSKGMMKKRAEIKNRFYTHNVVGGTINPNNETKLPYLNESVSNPLLDISSNSPYKVDSSFMKKYKKFNK